MREGQRRLDGRRVSLFGVPDSVGLSPRGPEKTCKTNLEAFVLQHLLDCDILPFLWGTDEFRLKNDTERAIADDLAVGVCKVQLVATFAFGCNNFDDLVWVVNG